MNMNNLTIRDLERIMVSTGDLFLQVDCENEIFSRMFSTGLYVVETTYEKCYYESKVCPKSLFCKLQEENLDDVPF